MRALVTALLVLLLLAPSWALAERSLVLVQWTDLHVGSPETRVANWEAALQDGLALRPDALLLTGDNVDNKCPRERFQGRVEGFLGRYGPRLLASGRPLLLAFGNNDFAENYQTDPENLAPVVAAWRRHLGRSFYLDDLGNGTYPRPVGGMTWITINSLVFSPHDEYEGKAPQALRTVGFLERELARVPAGRPVVLLSHIPPTWDHYSRGPAWELPWLARLRALLESRKGPVVIVSGHFHRNELHALSLSGGRAAPILDAGALSDKYEQRANWRTYLWQLGPDGAPRAMHYRIRYTGHPDWDRRYTVEFPFLGRTWTGFVNRLASDRAFFERYTEDMWARKPSWRQSTATPDSRDALLRQVWVDTVGPAPAPEGALPLRTAAGF